MGSIKFFSVVVLSSVFMMSGCTVRTYKATRDRIDQELSAGNRGYLMGSVPPGLESNSKRSTRTTHVVEVELRSPLTLEKAPVEKSAPQTEPVAPVVAPVVIEQPAEFTPPVEVEAPKVTPVVEPVVSDQAVEDYTVQKNETLQKISDKLYGTTKKWVKIFELNKDVLKGPNKIYPGQVIKVPAYSHKTAQPETTENLK